MADYQGMASSIAQQYGIPSNVFTSLIQGESGFNPNAFNSGASSGAYGLGQILGSTAASPGYGLTPLTGDLFDPQNNLDFSARYLSALYGKSGSWADAINAYTGGTAPAATRTAANAADGSHWYDSLLHPDQTNAPQLDANGVPIAQPDLQQDPTSKTKGNSGTTWLDGVVGYLQQAGVILLGLIIVGVGLFMLKDKSE